MEEDQILEWQKAESRDRVSFGWRLGKKIAIVGVAVSSAPIVLPPLVLFSALGFAFSVPFGLVFAGYACTDRLMSLLLPSHSQGFPDSDGDDAAEKGDVMEFEVADQPVAEDNKGKEEIKRELGEKAMEGDANGFGNDGEIDLNGKEKEGRFVGIRGEDSQVVETTKEDEIKEGKADEIGETGEGREVAGREENVQQIAEDEHGGRSQVLVIDDATEDKNMVPDQYLSQGQVEDIFESRKQLPDADLKLSHLGSKEEFATVEENALGGIGTNMEDSVDHPDISSKAATTVSYEVDIEEPPDEFLHTEAEIWKQINAMRMIVGYKAAPNSNYVDELNALCLFTGVEPPLSLINSSGLIEVNDKLQFLKSVVGVK